MTRKVMTLKAYFAGETIKDHNGEFIVPNGCFAIYFKKTIDGEIEIIPNKASHFIVNPMTKYLDVVDNWISRIKNNNDTSYDEQVVIIKELVFIKSLNDWIPLQKNNFREINKYMEGK